MSLTRELRDPRSPVRRFLDESFPTHVQLRRAFHDGAGPLLVNGTSAHPGTLGTATDWLFRFLTWPHPDLHLPCLGASLTTPAIIGAFDELSTMLHYEDALAPITVGHGTIEPSVFTGPSPGVHDVDFDLLARACWALALLTEVFRAGAPVLERGPLNEVKDWGIVTAEDLLALAPSDALEELAGLRNVLVQKLLPRLQTRRGRWTIGPTFTGSADVGGADADLISAGQLLELKTSLGRTSASGERACELTKYDLLELLGYALLDYDDRYEIDELALFSARYGHFMSWPLDALIDRLSHGALDVVSARSGMQAAARVTGFG